jgi:hypothetical protein
VHRPARPSRRPPVLGLAIGGARKWRCRGIGVGGGGECRAGDRRQRAGGAAWASGGMAAADRRGGRGRVAALLLGIQDGTWRFVLTSTNFVSVIIGI